LSIDILIGLIQKLLTQRQDFKVIITSATLDAALFERYFETKTFKVSGRLFPV
jgi:HrpA-like RNA helicase